MAAMSIVGPVYATPVIEATHSVGYAGGCPLREPIPSRSIRAALPSRKRARICAVLRPGASCGADPALIYARTAAALATKAGGAGVPAETVSTS